MRTRSSVFRTPTKRWNSATRTLCRRIRSHAGGPSRSRSCPDSAARVWFRPGANADRAVRGAPTRSRRRPNPARTCAGAGAVDSRRRPSPPHDRGPSGSTRPEPVLAAPSDSPEQVGMVRGPRFFPEQLPVARLQGLGLLVAQSLDLLVNFAIHGVHTFPTNPSPGQCPCTLDPRANSKSETGFDGCKRRRDARENLLFSGSSRAP